MGLPLFVAKTTKGAILFASDNSLWPMPKGTEAPYRLSYPALSQHLANGLAAAARTLDLLDDGTPVSIEPTKTRGLYRSAIALSLSPRHARDLAERLGSLAYSSLSECCLNQIQIRPQDSGWIEFQISTALQLACINDVAEKRPEISPLVPKGWGATLGPASIFELQYAHARCCSLLKQSQPKSTGQGDLTAPWIDAYFDSHPNSVEQSLWISLLNFPTQLLGGRQIVPSAHGPDSFLRCQIFIDPSYLAKHLHRLGDFWAQIFQHFHGSAQLLCLPEYQPLFSLKRMLYRALKNLIGCLLSQFYRHVAPQIL